MIEHVVRRVRKTKDETIGIFIFDDRPIWTLEDPDKNNAPNISCIPSGGYECEIVKSSVNLSIGFDVAYAIIGVTGRSLIRFMHPAYDEDDVEGCIAGGLKVDLKAGAILDSRIACKLFYNRMQELTGLNPFMLKIIDC